MKKIPALHLPYLNYRKIAVYAAIFGVALFAVSGYFAYDRLYLTKERRFWIAIENNLNVASVVKEVQLGGTGNKTIDKTRFYFGSKPAINKISSISQVSATQNSGVVTETLQTPTQQFVKYNDIFTNEKKEDGSEFNFSEVENVWAKQSEAVEATEIGEARLSYAQPHVTLAPFGYLPASARKEIVRNLKESGAYDIDFNAASKEEVDGEKYMLYNVKVQTKKYVAALQKHFTAIGLGEFPPLNPDNYPANARVNAQFLINTNSNVLNGLVFNDITERFSNFGVTNQASVPESYVTIEELQDNLQSLQ